jgi:hypothetical protein
LIRRAKHWQNGIIEMCRFAVLIPAIEPASDPATPKPGRAIALAAVTLPIDGPYGPVIEARPGGRMLA